MAERKERSRSRESRPRSDLSDAEQAEGQDLARSIGATVGTVLNIADLALLAFTAVALVSGVGTIPALLVLGTRFVCKNLIMKGAVRVGVWAAKKLGKTALGRAAGRGIAKLGKGLAQTALGKAAIGTVRFLGKAGQAIGSAVAAVGRGIGIAFRTAIQPFVWAGRMIAKPFIWAGRAIAKPFIWAGRKIGKHLLRPVGRFLSRNIFRPVGRVLSKYVVKPIARVVRPIVQRVQKSWIYKKVLGPLVVKPLVKAAKYIRRTVTSIWSGRQAWKRAMGLILKALGTAMQVGASAVGAGLAAGFNADPVKAMSSTRGRGLTNEDPNSRSARAAARMEAMRETAGQTVGPGKRVGVGLQSPQVPNLQPSIAERIAQGDLPRPQAKSFLVKTMDPAKASEQAGQKASEQAVFVPVSKAESKSRKVAEEHHPANQELGR